MLNINIELLKDLQQIENSFVQGYTTSNSLNFYQFVYNDKQLALKGANIIFTITQFSGDTNFYLNYGKKPENVTDYQWSFFVGAYSNRNLFQLTVQETETFDPDLNQTFYLAVQGTAEPSSFTISYEIKHREKKLNNNVQFFGQIFNNSFQNFTIFSTNIQSTTQSSFNFTINFNINGKLNLYIKSCGSSDLNCSITEDDIKQESIDPNIEIHKNVEDNYTIYLTQTTDFEYFSLAILNNQTTSTIYNLYPSIKCLINQVNLEDTIPIQIDNQMRNQVKYFKYQADQQEFQNKSLITSLDLNLTLIYGDATVYISQDIQNPNEKHNLQAFNLSQSNYLTLTSADLGNHTIFDPIYIGISTFQTKMPIIYTFTAHLNQQLYQLTYLSLGIPITYTYFENKQNFFCFKGYNEKSNSNKVVSEIYYLVQIEPISGDFEMYFGDSYMPKTDDYNISTGDYYIRIDSQDQLFQENQLSYILIDLINQTNSETAPSFKSQLLNSLLIYYIYPFNQSQQNLIGNVASYLSFNFYPGTHSIDLLFGLQNEDNITEIKVLYQVAETNSYINFNDISSYTELSHGTKVQQSFTENDWKSCNFSVIKQCTIYFMVSILESVQELNYINQLNITLNPYEMKENEEALNWCLKSDPNYYYIKLEKLIQILTIKVALSEPANFTLLAIAKDSSKLSNTTTEWPYPDIKTPESYTFNTKFLVNETITNTTLELIFSDIQKNSQCSFKNSSCYILFSAYNFEQYYSYQLKVNVLPIITYITNSNLTFNTSTNSSVQSQAYTYFNINLDNCTECNLYFTIKNISNPEANLQLLVNKGQENYPTINQSNWNTSTQFEDFTITNLSSGAYTVGVFSDKDINFTIISNKGQFCLVELELGQNQIIKLNETIPIIYLKLFEFHEEDLKLLFENVEEDQLEVYITNIDQAQAELIENLPNIDNAYWSSKTQATNEKFIFWMAIGQENFCSNCTYLVKLQAKVTEDIEILVIPASSTTETQLDNGQAIKDESNENQTTTYKFSTEEKYDQNITITMFEGKIVMKVRAVDQQDPDKYDWEELNLTEIYTNDANGSKYQAVRKPKPDETYALFQAVCESQNTTNECISIYNIQILNTNDSTLLEKDAYQQIILQIKDNTTYQLNSAELDNLTIIFQYRNCTLIQLSKELKQIVTCQMAPSINITYYLNSDAQKTEHTVDLQNLTISKQINDFLVVNPKIQNATYTIKLKNDQNDTVYCGMFYENSADYNEITLLSQRDSFQELYYQQIIISEIFQQTLTTPHLLQVEIAQCSGFIHAYISDQFGDIQFDTTKTLKLETTKFKYCRNLANELSIIETPIYIKYHSTAESILTTKNEFQVQLNYVPEGVDNAYNCLYPGNNGAIEIEKYENDIVFSVEQIQQTISCQNAFTYEIKGYWLALNKEQSQIECSLNLQTSKDVSYFHFYKIHDNPPQKLSAMLSYDDFSAKSNDQFLVGIQVLVEVKYSAEGITNNYTFQYKTELFNCEPNEKTPTKPDTSGLTGGEKAGIAIGVIVGVAAIGIALWLYVKRNQRRRDALINFEEDSNAQIDYNKRAQNQDLELNYQGKKEKYNQFQDGL